MEMEVRPRECRADRKQPEEVAEYFLHPAVGPVLIRQLKKQFDRVGSTGTVGHRNLFPQVVKDQPFGQEESVEPSVSSGIMLCAEQRMGQLVVHVGQVEQELHFRKGDAHQLKIRPDEKVVLGEHAHGGQLDRIDDFIAHPVEQLDHRALVFATPDDRCHRLIFYTVDV
jgi:hypothetical protein